MKCKDKDAASFIPYKARLLIHRNSQISIFLMKCKDKDAASFIPYKARLLIRRNSQKN